MSKPVVPPGIKFKTSSFSKDGVTFKVQVAILPDGQGAVMRQEGKEDLVFNKTEWVAFLKGAKNYEFDV